VPETAVKRIIPLKSIAPRQAARAQFALGSLLGVKSCFVDAARSQIIVTYDAGVCLLMTIIRALHDLGILVPGFASLYTCRYYSVVHLAEPVDKHVAERVEARLRSLPGINRLELSDGLNCLCVGHDLPPRALLRELMWCGMPLSLTLFKTGQTARAPAADNLYRVGLKALRRLHPMCWPMYGALAYVLAQLLSRSTRRQEAQPVRVEFGSYVQRHPPGEAVPGAKVQVRKWDCMPLPAEVLQGTVTDELGHTYGRSSLIPPFARINFGEARAELLPGELLEQQDGCAPAEWFARIGIGAVRWYTSRLASRSYLADTEGPSGDVARAVSALSYCRGDAGSTDAIPVEWKRIVALHSGGFKFRSAAGWLYLGTPELFGGEPRPGRREVWFGPLNRASARLTLETLPPDLPGARRLRSAGFRQAGLCDAPPGGLAVAWDRLSGATRLSIFAGGKAAELKLLPPDQVADYVRQSRQAWRLTRTLAMTLGVLALGFWTPLPLWLAGVGVAAGATWANWRACVKPSLKETEGRYREPEGTVRSTKVPEYQSTKG
jgi:hypothetical protein